MADALADNLARQLDELEAMRAIYDVTLYTDAEEMAKLRSAADNDPPPRAAICNEYSNATARRG